MRKKLFLLLSLIAVVLLTGCTKYDLDLEKVKEKITSLKEDKIDASLVYGEVNMNEKFQNLEYIYEFDYEEYGFNVDYLDKYSFAFDKETKEFYILFKAKDDKTDVVKKNIKDFVENLKKDEKDDAIISRLNNYILREEDGYFMALAASNQDELLQIIRNSKNPVFSNMMEIPVESIEDTLGIKEDQVDEFLMATPMMIVRSDTYIIVKPSKGNKEVVKEKTDEYMSNLEKQWETYLPEQYELVKNRLEKELGDYLIYVVSIDNELVYETIKDCKK